MPAKPFKPPWKDIRNALRRLARDWSKWTGATYFAARRGDAPVDEIRRELLALIAEIDSAFHASRLALDDLEELEEG